MSLKATIGRRWLGNECEVGVVRQGVKIKIPLWPPVNLRLLTAQRSCCVTGFLMTLQQPLPQIALTWFISPFYSHPHTPIRLHHTTPNQHHLHHPAIVIPPSLPSHNCHSSIQFLYLFSSLWIFTAVCCRLNTISSSTPCQWQGASVLRSPCHTELESGGVAHSTAQSGNGLWAEQGKTGCDARASSRKLVPGSVLPFLPFAICMFACNILQA